MTTQNLETETWHIRLNRHHYYFFIKLAAEVGDLEQGASARACRKFLNEKIKEYKRTHNEKKVI